MPFTPELVLELHRSVTEDALDDPDAAGQLRAPGVEVVVDDLYGTVFHVPPPTEQLPERMVRMCAFTNGSTPEEFELVEQPFLDQCPLPAVQAGCRWFETGIANGSARGRRLGAK